LAEGVEMTKHIYWRPFDVAQDMLGGKINPKIASRKGAKFAKFRMNQDRGREEKNGWVERGLCVLGVPSTSLRECLAGE
jgi:hypothetical protein